jgi:hypothetical protein
MTDTSPAVLLRQAATQIRERARAAAPGPWKLTRASQDLRLESPALGDELASWTYSVRPWEPSDWDECDTAVPEHIASWHPDVALAVAELLDFSAATSRILDAVGQDPDNRPTHHYALAVARTYLGIEETP